MKIRNKIISLAVAGIIAAGSTFASFADGSKVVTLGVDLSSRQKQMMLNYFGVKSNEAMIIDVSNAEERHYLEGVASESQLGRRTISCAYVEPTSKGGINVKTANLTWVTGSMIASTLTTAGMTNANVIAAAPYAVSGTGALTGVIKAFEDASGEKLDETKKEIANEELVTTGDLGDSIGQDKASGIVNDIKAEVIKNGTNDTVQIADIINNVTNNYNISLTPEQIAALTELMQKISSQNYDYSSIKDTLENVQYNVSEKLESAGDSVNTVGIFDKIKHWFSNIFSSDSGILSQTDESALGSDAVISATEEKLEKAANEALNQVNEVYNQAKESGLFDKIKAWFEEIISGFQN